MVSCPTAFSKANSFSRLTVKLEQTVQFWKSPRMEIAQCLYRIRGRTVRKDNPAIKPVPEVIMTPAGLGLQLPSGNVPQKKKKKKHITIEAMSNKILPVRSMNPSETFQFQGMLIYFIFCKKCWRITFWQMHFHLVRERRTNLLILI